MFGDARREAALECKGKPDRLLFHSSSYSSLFGFLKKTGKSLLFSLFPRFGSLLWSPSALFPSLPLPSRMIVDTETTIGLSGLQAKGCAGSQKSSGARAALADGPRVACPLAPGTSASLASAGATNGGAGPGARPRRRGRGPRAVRGAAAVAVTSREGVGAARQQPDYKRTRPAAAGVARRPSPPPPLLAPAPFFFFSSNLNFLLLLLVLPRPLRRCLLHNFPRKFRNSTPRRPGRARQPPRGAAGELRGRAAARASPSLHLSPPPPPLPPGARLWADRPRRRRQRRQRRWGHLLPPAPSPGSPAPPAVPHVRGRSWSAGSVLPRPFL